LLVTFNLGGNTICID